MNLKKTIPFVLIIAGGIAFDLGAEMTGFALVMAGFVALPFNI